MTKHRTELERAAGKLISSIQSMWHDEAGEPESADSEQVMHKSHGLLAAAIRGSLTSELGGSTVADYLGQSWVSAHPQVWPAIKALERADRGDA